MFLESNFSPFMVKFREIGVL